MPSSCEGPSPSWTPATAHEPPSRPPPPQPDFYLNTVRGLEEIAAGEAARLGAAVVAVRPSKVFLRFDGEPALLLDLRSAMAVFAFIAERRGLPLDTSAQPRYQDAARQLDLAPALARRASLGPLPASPSFRITATRAGDQQYTSQQIAAWVGAGVQALTGWRVDLEHYDHDLEVEAVRRRALFGLRLGPCWRERHTKAAYHPASLNPTVAYAMIQLVGMHPSDVFLDPTCGGGTLLTERAALGPARLLLGGDIWPRSLQYARRNLEAAAARASLALWDAQHLPLRDASVDRAVANLPFGHRVGRGPAVRACYRGLVPELSRLLRPGGRAVLLTSRRSWLALAVADNPSLSHERTLPIRLGGKDAFIFLLSRLP